MARPVIALLTDFGTADPFVGIMKGVVLSRCPEANVVDLTHDVPAQSVAEGAFLLERSIRWFPPATIFVAVIDPGVGTERSGLVVEAHGQVFVAPDNGLLGPTLADADARAAHVIDAAALSLDVRSRTFHGRDVFAPVAAEIAARRLGPRDVGPRATSIVASNAPVAVEHPDRVEGVVVTVDRFGNLITNIRADRLHAGRPIVEIGSLSLPLSGTYAEVPPLSPLALVNAYDVVEVAYRDGNAAQRLGLGRGERVIVRFR